MSDYIIIDFSQEENHSLLNLMLLDSSNFKFFMKIQPEGIYLAANFVTTSDIPDSGYQLTNMSEVFTRFTEIPKMLGVFESEHSFSQTVGSPLECHIETSTDEYSLGKCMVISNDSLTQNLGIFGMRSLTTGAYGTIPSGAKINFSGRIDYNMTKNMI